MNLEVSTHTQTHEKSTKENQDSGLFSCDQMI